MIIIIKLFIETSIGEKRNYRYQETFKIRRILLLLLLAINRRRCTNAVAIGPMALQENKDWTNAKVTALIPAVIKIVGMPGF
jgi:hypothetical protein